MTFQMRTGVEALTALKHRSGVQPDAVAGSGNFDDGTGELKAAQRDADLMTCRERKTADPDGAGPAAEDTNAVRLLPGQYFSRHEAATALIDALMIAHLEDAVNLSAVFLDLACKGAPLPRFLDLETEANSWVALAEPTERLVYLAALARGMDETITMRNALKRALLACWEKLPTADRMAFLARVDPDGAFRKVAE